MYSNAEMKALFAGARTRPALSLEEDVAAATQTAQTSLKKLTQELPCATETGKLECCVLCKEQPVCKRWLFGNNQAPTQQALCWLNYIITKQHEANGNEGTFDAKQIEKLATLELQLRRSNKLLEIQKSADASQQLLARRRGGLSPSELLFFILNDAGTDTGLHLPLFHYQTRVLPALDTWGRSFVHIFVVLETNKESRAMVHAPESNCKLTWSLKDGKKERSEKADEGLGFKAGLGELEAHTCSGDRATRGGGTVTILLTPCGGDYGSSTCCKNQAAYRFVMEAMLPGGTDGGGGVGGEGA
jgi:hypothetical protein